MQVVGHQIEDGEVVFDHEHGATLLVRHLLKQAGDRDALADVEVRRDFVEEVEVGVAGQRRRQGDALEFTAGEAVDVLVHHVLDFESLQQVVEDAAFVGSGEQLGGAAVEPVGNLVDVLRFSGDGDVAVPDLAEVVLKLGSAVAVEDVVPSRRVLELAEVGREFARENLHRGRFPAPVRAENPRDLPLLGYRQSVEREGVFAVAVDGVFL